MVYAGKKIISFKYIWPIVLGGIAGVIVGYTLLSHISSAIVRKMFAAFLLLSGIFSLIKSVKKEKATDKNLFESLEKTTVPIIAPKAEAGRIVIILLKMCIRDRRDCIFFPQPEIHEPP